MSKLIKQMSTLEFNHLVSSNSQQLKGFAFNFTRNMEDAEDLIADLKFALSQVVNEEQPGQTSVS